MHAVEQEIIDITEFKPRKKYSDRQDYLKSLLLATTHITDEDYDKLTDDAVEWINQNTNIFNKNSKLDLLDFDEVPPPESEADDDTEPEDEDDNEPAGESDTPSDIHTASDDDAADTGPVGDDEPDNSTDDADADGSDVSGSSAPVKKKKEPRKLQKTPKNARPDKVTPKAQEPTGDEPDAQLDKWGCIVGSKNGMALAMFEKGATSREVKEALGGTYYNILARMEQRGHKLTKEGSVITITHKDSLNKSSPKKAKK